MVLAEAGIDTPPALDGIFIGGQPIANIYKSNYAVFWSSEPTDNRLYIGDLLYGDGSTGNGSAAGIFDCPTFSGVSQPAFSMAMSPANTTTAGCYQSLPNGGRISVNWRVVSIPEIPDTVNDPKGRLYNERRKIAGAESDHPDQGMPGLGRWYSPKCGIVAINGGSYSAASEVQVNRGDYVTYLIRGASFVGQCGFDKDSGVTADDIDSRVNGIRSATDAALQVGEVFLCNRTLLRVEQRPSHVWAPQAEGGGADDMSYTLRVVDFTGYNRWIGVAGNTLISDFVTSEGGKSDNPVSDPDSKGASWYCLSKCDLGQVRSTRATEVVELGIKSQVWNKAEGLCNYNNVPAPSELVVYDDNRVNLSAGNMNKYMNRTSFFVVAVKDISNPQGNVSPGGQEISDSDGLFDGFDILDGLTFAVQGNTPVDVYNFIRIQNPEKKEYEYRIIPKSSTNIIRFLDDQVPNVWVLSASAPSRIQPVSTIHYGTFQLTFNADAKPMHSLLELEELVAGDKNRINYAMSCSVSNLAYIGVIGGTGSGAMGGGGYEQAWMESIFGNLKPHAGNTSKAIFGESRVGYFSVIDGNNSFDVRGHATVVDAGPDKLAKAGTAKVWVPTSWEVFNSVGEVVEGERFVVTRGSVVSGGTPVPETWYGRYFGITSTNVAFSANGIRCVEGPPHPGYERNFAWRQQAKEMSPWAEWASSCDREPEHKISYINESSSTPSVPDYFNMTCMGIKLKSLNRLVSFQQMQVWLPNGISVENLIDGTRGPSNNFADTLWYLLTTSGNALGGQISERLLDKPAFTLAAKFMANYWQRFDGSISDQVNLRSWATALAPMFLCNFVVANGKFSLVPGVPVDNSGAMIRGPVPIDAYFNDSNIIEGSFELQFLNENERQPFRAVMLYRDSEPNSLVELESVMVKWNTSAGNIPPLQEDYDMSNFCTRRSHALAAARYLLSIRRRVDHTVKFQTLPQGLALGPGDYIRLDTAASPYQSIYNVAVNENLSLLTPAQVADGTYTAFVYRQASSEVVEEQITIVNQAVTDPSLSGALLNIPDPSPTRLGVYMVEELSLSEDGIVDIVASHFPVNADLSSKIVEDILNPALFEVID
jgi:hypothetical protein